MSGIEAYVTRAMRLDSQRLDVHAQNLANADTPGFCRMMLLARSGGAQLVVDQTPGPVTPVVDPMQVAINGNGWLAVSNGRATELTRTGDLMRGADGLLHTRHGETVLGQNGPIKIGTGAVDFKADGSVWQNGSSVGRMQVVVPSDPSSLRAVGDGYYTASGVKQASATVVKGAREASNVDEVSEVTGLIHATSFFQIAQKVVLTGDDANKKLTDDVGRTR